MLWRIVRWRIGYEFWNVVAALMQVPPFSIFLARLERPIVHFAYGANLDPVVLAQRKISVLKQCEFLLRDHTLTFSRPSAYAGCGYGSITPAPGKLVYGRLLTLRKIDAIRLDYAEMAPVLGRQRRVWVRQQGRAFFFYQATCPRTDLKPTAAYRDQILQAAVQSPIIPKELLSELRTTPVATSLPPEPDAALVIARDETPPRWLRPLHRWHNHLCGRLLWKMHTASITERLLHTKRPSVKTVISEQ